MLFLSIIFYLKLWKSTKKWPVPGVLTQNEIVLQFKPM